MSANKPTLTSGEQALVDAANQYWAAEQPTTREIFDYNKDEAGELNAIFGLRHAKARHEKNAAEVARLTPTQREWAAKNRRYSAAEQLLEFAKPLFEQLYSLDTTNFDPSLLVEHPERLNQLDNQSLAALVMNTPPEHLTWELQSILQPVKGEHEAEAEELAKKITAQFITAAVTAKIQNLSSGAKGTDEWRAQKEKAYH